MTLLIVWLFFGLLGALIGQKKGINPALAFIAGFLLGPFALLMVFVSSESKKCPKCAELIKKEAHFCKHCKHEF